VNESQDRTTAAIAVAQLIGRLVDDHESIAVIATDVADCWRDLAPAVRDAYRPDAGSPPLAQFAGDYCDLVDGSWWALGATPPNLTEAEALLMCRLSWQIRVAQVAQRQTLGLAPEPERLALLATAETIAR
jgi:hypothetical protein